MARSACSRGRTVRGVLHEWGRLGGGIFDGSNDEGCHRIQPATAPGTTAGMTSDGTVVFGRAFNFGESAILANIYTQAATAAGVPTEVRSVGPREVVYPQLFNGELGVRAGVLGHGGRRTRR